MNQNKLDYSLESDHKHRSLTIDTDTMYIKTIYYDEKGFQKLQFYRRFISLQCQVVICFTCNEILDTADLCTIAGNLHRQLTDAC